MPYQGGGNDCCCCLCGGVEGCCLGWCHGRNATCLDPEIDAILTVSGVSCGSPPCASGLICGTPPYNFNGTFRLKANCGNDACNWCFKVDPVFNVGLGFGYLMFPAIMVPPRLVVALVISPTLPFPTIIGSWNFDHPCRKNDPLRVECANPLPPDGGAIFTLGAGPPPCVNPANNWILPPTVKVSCP